MKDNQADEDVPGGSGVKYAASRGTNAQISTSNPLGYIEDNWRGGTYLAPDYSKYAPTPVGPARDSFAFARFPGGVDRSQMSATEKFGLGIADRVSDYKYGGRTSDEKQAYFASRAAAMNPKTSMLSEDELAFYASGGEAQWDVSVGEFSGASNVVGTLRDELIANVEGKNDTGTKVTWLALHSPAALQAIVEQGMDPQDVASVHNVYVAQSAVKRSMEFVDLGLPIAAMQLINVLPVDQRIIASALLHSEIEDKNAQAASELAQQEAEQKAFTDQNADIPSLDANTTPTSLQPIPSNASGGYGPEVEGGGMQVLMWLLEATLWGVENVTRTANMFVQTGNTMIFDGGNFGASITPYTGEQQITDSFASRLGAAWQAAGPNFISMEGYNNLVDKWGDKEMVNLALGLYEAERSDDPDAVEKFKQTLTNNPRAMAEIQAGLTGQNVGNGSLAEIMVDVYAQDQGNYGNTVMGMLPVESGTIPYAIGRDVVNVGSWFVYDPLVWAGAAGKAFRGAKYGVQVLSEYGGRMGNVIRAERLGPLAESRLLGRVTGFNGVRAEYEQFGSAIKAYKEARASAEEGAAGRADAILNRARKTWFKKRNTILSDEDWKVGVDNDLFTAEDWARYFDELDDAKEILKGKKIALKQPVSTQDDAFNQINTAMADRSAEETLAYEGMNMAISNVQGQTVRRGVYMPHSTAAKAWGRAMRGPWENTAVPAHMERGVAAMEKMMASHDAWDYMTVEGKMKAFNHAITTDPEFARMFGLEMGDWKLIDGQMQRTVVGRWIDTMYEHGEGAQRVLWSLGFLKRRKDKDGTVYLKQKGWKRDRSLFDPKGRVNGMAETWSRLVTRLPNLPHGLDVSSAKHADEVYRMSMAAGMGRAGSRIIRLAWTEGDAGARQNILTGLVRSYTAAMGLDAVDPHLSARVLREMTGLRPKEEYAANAIVNEAGIKATVREEVRIANEERRKALLLEPMPKYDDELAQIEARLAGGLNPEQAAGLRKRRAQVRKNKAAAVKNAMKRIDDDKDFEAALTAERREGGRLSRSNATNPAQTRGGRVAALYPGQTSDYVAVPNIRAMDQYAARQSWLNSFLFQGAAGTNVTEAWVLGSLYGPRFALRNAFEDIAMFVLTGGKLGKFFKGRRLDEAIDGAMARVNRDFLVAQQRYDIAVREYEIAQKMHAKGQMDLNKLAAAKGELDTATTLYNMKRNEKTLFGASKYGQHKKRGIVRTAIMNMAERLSWTAAGHERDTITGKVARLMVPTTSRAERVAALEKGPEAMIQLSEAAVLRQNVVWNRPGWRKIIPSRAEKMEDLTPRQLQYMKDEADFLNSSFGLQNKDAAAEAASHLMDGSVPTLTNGGRFVFDSHGNLMRRIPVDQGYSTVLINGNVLTPRQARGLIARLSFMTDNTGLTQAAMHEVPNYWRALNAVGGPDTAKLDEIADIVLGFARESRDWPYVASRFRIMDERGAHEHVRRMLDDMSAAFTKRSGDDLWNQELWKALRLTDPKTGKIRFGMDEVHEVDFLTGKFDTPSSVLVHGSEDFVEVPAKDMWSTAAWEQMGRSMSRMSRNPIFYSNYLQSREALRPLERQWAEVFGEEYARKRFADAAAERALELTMSFVDNPAIRSNLSWQVRNIARYYRAQEDFVRRVMRMVKFDPVSIQKANLAWQAQQDLGFVHRDDYGNDYFLYPGSAAAMNALQTVMGVVGLDNLKYPTAPMAFGGNVQWLSPSLDLGSAAPTLSSPWMAVTLQPLLREMPFAQDFFKTVERYAFGDVSANMDYTDLNLGDGYLEATAAAFYQTLPPVVKKTISIGESMSGNFLPGSFGYKMTVKTVMGMAAADQLPSERDIADPDKRKEWLDVMSRRTVEMSFLSLIFGLWAPASPQYTEDTLSMSAREEGLTALAPGLREGIMASVKNGESWEEGYIKWMKDNPSQAGVIVSSSQSVGGAYVEATMANVDFIESNRELFDENKVGFTFFVPDERGAGGGAEGDAAWRAMKGFDLREYRELGAIVDEVLMAESKLNKSMLDVYIADVEAGIVHYDANGNITDQWRAHVVEKEKAYARLNADSPAQDQGYTLADEDAILPQADEIVTVNRALRGKSQFADVTADFIESYVRFRDDYNRFLVGGDQSSLNRGDLKENFKAEWQRVVSWFWSTAEGKYPKDNAQKMVTLFTRSLNTSWRDITLEGEQ